MPRAPLFRGNYLRMAFLRFRLAHIIVAVLRSTALRRVVDGSLDHHRYRTGPSSSLLPGVNTVRPHPSGFGRSVLTPGPHRLLKSNQAPHLWCVAVQKTVRRTFAREVDRPFHIIAGKVGPFGTSGLPAGPQCRSRLRLLGR